MIQGGDAAAGDSGRPRAGEFDQFLAELAGVVTERIQAMSPGNVARPDPVFFDESKTIVEWPELTAYVIEELR